MVGRRGRGRREGSFQSFEEVPPARGLKHNRKAGSPVDTATQPPSLDSGAAPWVTAGWSACKGRAGRRGGGALLGSSQVAGGKDLASTTHRCNVEDLHRVVVRGGGDVGRVPGPCNVRHTLQVALQSAQQLAIHWVPQLHRLVRSCSNGLFFPKPKPNHFGSSRQAKKKKKSTEATGLTHQPPHPTNEDRRSTGGLCNHAAG